MHFRKQGMSPGARAEICQDCSRHRAAVPAGGRGGGGGAGGGGSGVGWRGSMGCGGGGGGGGMGPPATPQGYWDTSIPESETQDLD